MRSGKVLAGLMAVIAAGALLGVMFAPDIGFITRKRIIKKSEDYIEGLVEKINVFLDNICEKFNMSGESEGPETVESEE
jgi:gas vesicle protein